jgi:hypothetical protein
MILAVYSAEPNFPPSDQHPNADRFYKSGWWVDAVGAPTDTEVAAYLSPPPTADDVRNEAQRRIMALMGARDLNDCVIKQLNANKTAVALNDRRIGGGALTAEEEATATALRNLAVVIDAIRAASNLIEADPPADYTDDKYWP